MRERQSSAIVLVGKNTLFREGLAGILRSGNFRVLASVSCADDLLSSKLQLHQPLFLVVHTGDDFDAAVKQIELLRDQHPGALPLSPIIIGQATSFQHFEQAPTAILSTSWTARCSSNPLNW